MLDRQKDTRSLEERLQAERPMLPAPDGFTDRVIANLPPMRPSIAGPVPNPWPRLALGLATVAVLAVVSIRFLPSNSGPQAVIEVAATQPQPPAASDPIEIDLPRLPAGHLEALSVRLDQPLEKELENVISDTRQAIQFVASSFLPEN